MTSGEAPVSSFFVSGGTMKPGAPSYIHRAADEELYNALLAGQYCSVLTTRQMGKSSLMARTAERLRALGIHCATVDLQGSGQKSAQPEPWYYGFTKQVADGLQLSRDWTDWWKKQEALLPVQRMRDFFADVVLPQLEGKIVVFIDEVDWMIRLPFSDEFFAAIRSCYNRRATDPRFERLTFVLLGSAAPAQLIKDATRTPFNIGRGLELTDFTAEEAKPLAAPLGENGDAILARILYWTDGHPYLTQTLLSHVAAQMTAPIAAPTETQTRDSASPEALVDRIVEEKLLSTSARSQENNLKFVGERLTQGTSNLRKVLHVYRDVLKGKPVQDVPASPVHTSLRLSGAVKTDSERHLQIRNRIYRQVFTEKWIAEKMPTNLWLIAGSAAAVVLLGIFSFWYFVLFPKPYIHDLEASDSSVGTAANAYRALQKPFLRARANELYAQFWERREDRDAAILIRAKSGDRKGLAALIGYDYPFLQYAVRGQGEIRGAAFSSNGKSVVVWSNEGIRVLEAATGREIRRFPEYDVLSATLSSDGKLLGLDDKVVEVATGKEVLAVPHQKTVFSLAFNPDATLLAMGTYNGTVHIFNAKTRRQIFQVAGDRVPQYLAFSPDSKLLAVVSSSQVLYLISIPNRKITARLTDVKSETVAFSPDGKQMIAGCVVTTACIYDVAPSREMVLFSGNVYLTSAIFSSDGKLVAVGSSDATVRVFEAATGRELARFIQPSPVMAIAFTPDQDHVIALSDKSVVQIFAIPRLQAVPQAQPSNGVSYSTNSDGTLYAAQRSDGTIQILDTETRQKTASLPPQPIFDSLLLSQDGKLLAVRKDRSMRVLDVASGGELMHADLVGREGIFAFSRDGTLLATREIMGHNSRVFEVATGRVEWHANQDAETTTLKFSSDEKQLAVGDFDGATTIIELNTGREISHLTPLQSEQTSQPIFVVQFSPDGKLVASGSITGEVRLFEAATGRPVTRLVYQSPIRSFAFSPDERLLVAVTDNWIHMCELTGDNCRPVGNRFAVLSSYGIQVLPPDRDCRHCVRVLRDIPGNPMAVEKIDFDHYNVAPVQGNPEELVREWSQKLGITLDAQGQIVPFKTALSQ